MLDRLYVESQRWRNLVHILTVYSLQDGRLARIVQPTAPPQKKYIQQWPRCGEDVQHQQPHLLLLLPQLFQDGLEAHGRDT